MKTIGIIGGGQLGLMIAEQAHVLGVRAVALDPAPDAPAFRVCDDHIVAAYDDAAALERLCRMSDVVTYEFENVPGEILIPLCGKYNIPQGYKPLYDSQDRLREKTNARNHGLQTPGFAAADDETSLRAAVRELGLPAVLKTRTLGYDGHGQLVLKSEADIERALPLLTVPCILEEFIPFDSEASIVMVADKEHVVSFPVGRNIHRDGILDLSIVPAAASQEVLDRMKAQSERFMRECGYEGILAIEYFIRGGEIYWMVLVAALVAVGLLAISQVTVSYLWTRQGSGWTSALMAAGTVAMAAWVLPYLYKVSPRQRQGGPVGRWLLLAGLLGVALAALTRGVLGHAAGELPHPFFVTTGVMGESARLEGLLSALWLICDLVWAGLLARVWGDGKGPVLGVLLGIAVAFTGWTEALPVIVWPIGNLALAVLCALVPKGAEEIVAEES